MSIKKEKQEVDENRRDLSLLMPSIKKLMSNLNIARDPVTEGPILTPSLVR